MLYLMTTAGTKSGIVDVALAARVLNAYNAEFGTSYVATRKGKRWIMTYGPVSLDIRDAMRELTCLGVTF